MESTFNLDIRKLVKIFKKTKELVSESYGICINNANDNGMMVITVMLIAAMR